MKQKIWFKISLALLLVTFSLISRDCQANLVHAYPNSEYQMMNLPSDNLSVMGDTMNTPAMGFALVDNGQGQPVAYGISELNSNVGYGYSEDGTPYPINFTDSGFARTGNAQNDPLSHGLPDSAIVNVKDVGSYCDQTGTSFHPGYYYGPDGELYPEFRGAYRVGLEFVAGRYIAIDQNYGGVTFFAVPKAPTGYFNFLLDVKGFKLEKRNWAGSCGIGVRHFDKVRKKVYGLNAFYDYLDQHGSFHQMGLGFELFSKYWEVHVNGYLPLGKLHHNVSTRILAFKGAFLSIFRENQNALRGVEMSVGGRLYFLDNINLYVAPGLYFYNNKDLRRNMEGFQGTVELNWNELISARVNFSYDRVFRGRCQGVLTLNIPLNFNRCCQNVCDCRNPCDLLGYPVRRNDLIFLKKCCSTESNFDNCGLLIQ